MANNLWHGELRVAGGAIGFHPQTRITWPSAWSMALLNRKRQGGDEANRGPEFTGDSAVRPPTNGHWRVCNLSQWDSVLGQGFASSYDQLFKSFFWLSCPFSTQNARCKAPADALNVVTDYSWLTNRRAGSTPINRARFSPMPFQGDSGGALMVGRVDGVGQKKCSRKPWAKMIWWFCFNC